MSRKFPRSNPKPYTESPKYQIRIVDVHLILDNGEKQEPFRFITRRLQDFIQDWLKEEPENKFDRPDWFLRAIDAEREDVPTDSKLPGRPLTVRRVFGLRVVSAFELKFIRRELDLVESLYALGMHLTQEGKSVRVKVDQPYIEYSDKPQIPSQTPIDPRTKKHRLRKTR